MAASIAKDFDEEIGCAVDDGRVLAEIGDAVHKPAHFHNPADPVQIAITVGLMLILPLVLGVTLNTRRPDLTARIRRPLQWLSMGIFIAFIVIALAANWAQFLAYAGGIAGIVILHNALALGGGFATATLAGLSPFDRRAVTIETGIQNSGLGLVLIFAFFGGLGGMAVVAAFWGIWHAVSGLALAAVMARKEAAR